MIQGFGNYTQKITVDYPVKWLNEMEVSYMPSSNILLNLFIFFNDTYAYDSHSFMFPCLWVEKCLN